MGHPVQLRDAWSPFPVALTGAVGSRWQWDRVDPVRKVFLEFHFFPSTVATNNFSYILHFRISLQCYLAITDFFI